MDDTSTSACEAIDRLKIVIVSLSRELNTLLDDAVYMSMSSSQMQAYDEKRKELRRLVNELEQVHQFQQEPSAAIVPPARSSGTIAAGALEQPKDPA